MPLARSRTRLSPSQRVRLPSLFPRVKYPTTSFLVRESKTIPAVIQVTIRTRQATTRFNQSLMQLLCRSAGAVAKLYDISCLYNTPGFDTIQDECFTAPPTEQQVWCLPSDTRTPAVFNHSSLVRFQFHSRFRCRALFCPKPYGHRYQPQVCFSQRRRCVIRRRCEGSWDPRPRSHQYRLVAVDQCPGYALLVYPDHAWR